MQKIDPPNQRGEKEDLTRRARVITNRVASFNARKGMGAQNIKFSGSLGWDHSIKV